MAQTALAGTATVTIDGARTRLVGELTYKLSGEKREPLTGMDGVHGFKSTPDAGMIKGKFRNAGDIDIVALQAATDVTVQAELVNGKTILARNAWRNGELVEVDTEEGTFELEFASADVTEQ